MDGKQIVDEETGEIIENKTSPSNVPRITHTRGQLLDALRQSAQENMQQCAKRVGRNRRTVHNWINSADGDISPRLWGLILKAYHTDTAGAEEIANSDSSLKLKPSPVAEEKARRAAVAAADNDGRDPASRRPGEARWNRESRFFDLGTYTPPAITDGAKLFPTMHSLILAMLDARDSNGKTSSVSELREAFYTYWVTRTVNENQDEIMAYFDTIYLPKLIVDGDIIETDKGLSLAEHVYSSWVCMLQGDPRGTFQPAEKPTNGGAQWTPFESRYPVIEDLISETLI